MSTRTAHSHANALSPCDAAKNQNTNVLDTILSVCVWSFVPGNRLSKPRTEKAVKFFSRRIIAVLMYTGYVCKLSLSFRCCFFFFFFGKAIMPSWRFGTSQNSCPRFFWPSTKIRLRIWFVIAVCDSIDGRPFPETVANQKKETTELRHFEKGLQSPAGPCVSHLLYLRSSVLEFSIANGVKILFMK